MVRLTEVVVREKLGIWLYLDVPRRVLASGWRDEELLMRPC